MNNNIVNIKSFLPLSQSICTPPPVPSYLIDPFGDLSGILFKSTVIHFSGNTSFDTFLYIMLRNLATSLPSQIFNHLIGCNIVEVSMKATKDDIMMKF